MIARGLGDPEDARWHLVRPVPQLQQIPVCLRLHADLLTAFTAATGAALVAAGAYLDAKYHISKDLRALWLMRQIENATQEASKFASHELLSPEMLKLVSQCSP